VEKGPISLKMLRGLPAKEKNATLLHLKGRRKERRIGPLFAAHQEEDVDFLSEKREGYL